MTTIAEGVGFRAGGIAGATLVTADLTRARVFYLARLGFPLLHEEGDAFTFRAGSSDIPVRRCRSNDRAADSLAKEKLRVSFLRSLVAA